MLKECEITLQNYVYYTWCFFLFCILEYIKICASAVVAFTLLCLVGTRRGFTMKEAAPTETRQQPSCLL